MLVSNTRLQLARSRTDPARTDNYVMLKIGESKLKRRVVKHSLNLTNVAEANDATNMLDITVNADGSVAKAQASTAPS